MASDPMNSAVFNGSMLDLSVDDSEKRIDLRSACATAWQLLSSKDVAAVVLPASLAQRRVLARAGVLTAAGRAGARLVLNGNDVSVEGALHVDSTFPGIDWVAYAGPEGLGRLRVIDDLELPQRRPPSPLPNGRRYRWIDGLKAATALRHDAARFNGDADQVLYEAISNVARWSEARSAFACFSLTAGGGEQSFNRVHVVVADDGLGIIASVDQRRAARRLPDWRQESDIQSLAEEHGCGVEAALVLHLVQDAHGNRTVASTQDGHGLHTSGVLAHQWSGSFDLHTAGSESEIIVSRTGRGPLQVAEGERAASGTLFHVALEASPASREVGSASLTPASAQS